MKRVVAVIAGFGTVLVLSGCNPEEARPAGTVVTNVIKGGGAVAVPGGGVVVCSQFCPSGDR